MLNQPNTDSIERRLTNLTSLSNYRSTNATVDKPEQKGMKNRKQETGSQNVYCSYNNSRVDKARNTKV